MFGTLTIQELTDKLSGGHHEPERAALELRRRAHLKQDGALTALLRLARDGSSYALTALNDMDAPPDDLPQEATDQGLAPRNTVSKAALLAALHLLHYRPCFSCLRPEEMMEDPLFDDGGGTSTRVSSLPPAQPLLPPWAQE